VQAWWMVDYLPGDICLPDGVALLRLDVGYSPPDCGEQGILPRQIFCDLCRQKAWRSFLQTHFRWHCWSVCCRGTAPRPSGMSRSQHSCRHSRCRFPVPFAGDIGDRTHDAHAASVALQTDGCGSPTPDPVGRGRMQASTPIPLCACEVHCRQMASARATACHVQQ
jgi:hypothetical protein